jgi:hypothetical protein
MYFGAGVAATGGRSRGKSNELRYPARELFEPPCDRHRRYIEVLKTNPEEQAHV